MLRYLARRSVLLLATLAATSLLVFLLTQALPGDVGRIILGPFAAQEAVDRLNAQLGIDRPILLRYLAWATGLLEGDWGRSLRFEQPVAPLVLERLLRSLRLAGLALAVLVPLSIGFAVIAARREGGVFDRAASLAGLALGSTPEFVTGVVLILAFSIQLDWLPAQALAPPDAEILDVLRHLALPAACLILLLFAYPFRVARASVAAALASDYARVAALKGLSPAAVMRRHVLRNALAPVVAVFGAQIGWIVGGLVVVETLFRYPGVGSLLHFAATNKDVPLLVGCSVAVALIFALGNLAADVVIALLDPRVRHGAATA